MFGIPCWQETFVEEATLADNLASIGCEFVSLLLLPLMHYSRFHWNEIHPSGLLFILRITS